MIVCVSHKHELTGEPSVNRRYRFRQAIYFFINSDHASDEQVCSYARTSLFSVYFRGSSRKLSPKILPHWDDFVILSLRENFFQLVHPPWVIDTTYDTRKWALVDIQLPIEEHIDLGRFTIISYGGNTESTYLITIDPTLGTHKIVVLLSWKSIADTRTTNRLVQSKLSL